MLGGCFGNTEMTSLLSIYFHSHCRIFKFELGACYTSAAALLVSVLWWNREQNWSRNHFWQISRNAKRNATSGFVWTRGSGLSQAMKVLQRVRRLSWMHQRNIWSLVCQRKVRKIDSKLWTKQRKQLFRKSLYPKMGWSNFVVWRDGRNAHYWEASPHGSPWKHWYCCP